MTRTLTSNAETMAILDEVTWKRSQKVRADKPPVNHPVTLHQPVTWLKHSLGTCLILWKGRRVKNISAARKLFIRLEVFGYGGLLE